jgi:voltage-gated potassium channel
MAKVGLKTRYAYRRDATRLSLSVRAATIALLVNILLVILLGSLVLLHFERHVNPKINTYGDSVWLTWVTITTVGYGSNYPVTTGGKWTVVVIMVLGVGMLTTYFSVRSAKKVRDIKTKRKGTKVTLKSRDHYVVLGWNERAPFLLESLRKLLEPERTSIVLMCDREQLPYHDDYVFFVRGCPSSERDLKRANIGEARVAVLLADESDVSSGSDVDARTVLTALTIHSLNPAVRMTAEVVEPENIHHLELAGVDEVLDSNLVLGSLLARSARNFGLIEFVTQMLTAEPSEGLSRVEVDEDLAGMSAERREAYLLDERRVVPLALRSGGMVKHYSRTVELKPGDFIIIAKLPVTGSE